MAYKRIENPLWQTIVLVVTDDCNLNCRYCYEHSKSPNRMTFEIAKKAIDFFLEKESPFEGVIFELIGGEPFLEVELLDKICGYTEEKLKGHKWENNHVFAITTNGTLLGDPKVRDFMYKDRCRKIVGVSLDGVKEIHDYNRSNSFDAIMENWGFWRSLYPMCSVKATLNHEAIPYVFESAKFLIELGLDNIIMNTANENIWQDEDAALYYEQLIKLADYLLKDQKYNSIYISLFDDATIKPANKVQNWCGGGTCIAAVDYNGTIYPCLRFKCLDKQKPWVIGSVDAGIDENKLTPFFFAHHLRDCKCKDCDTRGGCASCIALNYDETGTIFKRASYACSMHKARVAANKYFFDRIKEIEGIKEVETE